MSIPMKNRIIEVGGTRWKVREAISREAADHAITMARCTGSVGSRHTRDMTRCGGEVIVEADVVRLNDDGSEMRGGI